MIPSAFPVPSTGSSPVAGHFMGPGTPTNQLSVIIHNVTRVWLYSKLGSPSSGVGPPYRKQRPTQSKILYGLWPEASMH